MPLLEAITRPAPRVTPVAWAAPLLAVLAAGALWTALEGRASSARLEAGLVFTAEACALSPGFADTLGGPLTAADCAQVERVARAEVAAAFAGLRLEVTSNATAFWTVHVLPYVPSRSRTLGAAGASLAFGPLGGRGTVGIMPLAAGAVRHAPAGASRADLLEAIGRGAGRSVVHELTHQIAGGAIDSSDAATYEYASVDRPAQYYGAVRWGKTGARIRSRLSR